MKPLIVLESVEALAYLTSGPASFPFQTLLQRVGLTKEQFDYGLASRPELWPADTTVIVSLGPWATEQVLGRFNDKPGFDDIRGYVETLQHTPIGHPVYVLPTYHPTYVRRGMSKLTGVLLHDLQYALQMSECGFHAHRAELLCDPAPDIFVEWVQSYESRLRDDPSVRVSFDIETPYKRSVGGEDLGLGDPSYDILQISFSHSVGEAISIPWSTPYLPAIARLLGSSGVKVAHNASYDYPRIVAAGIPIRGRVFDSMWAWHLLQSGLPKGLGWVATFHAKGQSRWKHLSAVEPARYNAIDAEVTLRIMESLQADLEVLGLWSTFLRHVVELDQDVLWPMTQTGVLVDIEGRKAASLHLKGEQVRLQTEMEAVVPLAARALKVYKSKPPTDVAMTVPVAGTRKTKVCTVCGSVDVTKPHVSQKFRKISTIPLLEGVEGPKESIKIPNPCLGGSLAATTVACQWVGVPIPFVPSKAQLLAYQREMKQKPILGERDKVTGKVTETFDDEALLKLRKRYPTDQLYPLIGKYRNAEKLLATYVGEFNPETGRWTGGMEMDSTGVIHTSYTHNPSTLRLSSQSPNLQTIPRGKTSEAKLIKKLIIARPGCVLTEIDFSAIEAVLVGYFAKSPTYIRLARLGIHDYLNSHILHRAGTISEPADPAWSDADLKLMFKDLKSRFKRERDTAKQLVHAGNYGQTPMRMRDSHPELFESIKAAKVLQDLYFSVCPEIRQWQEHTIALVDRQGYLRNPFGYLMRFWQVREWKREPDGRWVAEWGEEAKAALAAGPQSTGAGILKEAMIRLRSTIAGPYMRLTIHDSLLFEIPLNEVEGVMRVVREEMERPVPQLILPPEWGLGSCLAIGTESKIGQNWGEMENLHV